MKAADKARKAAQKEAEKVEKARAKCVMSSDNQFACGTLFTVARMALASECASEFKPFLRVAFGLDVQMSRPDTGSKQKRRRQQPRKPIRTPEPRPRRLCASSEVLTCDLVVSNISKLCL